MIVSARSFEWQDCPLALQRFAKPGQTFITQGASYEVHALCVFEGHVAFQIVDDSRLPAWVPAWFLLVEDRTIPDDWICSSFQDEPVLVLGPPFVAKDQESYARMVELDPNQVDAFWKRVDARSRATSDDV